MLAAPDEVGCDAPNGEGCGRRGDANAGVVGFAWECKRVVRSWVHERAMAARGCLVVGVVDIVIVDVEEER